MHGNDVGDDDSDLLADPSDARSNCGVGVVVDLDGGQSHRVLADALDALENLDHRGTTGAEPNTGDGAGALIQTPDALFADVFDGLPETYAVGSLFLPRDAEERERVVETVEDALADWGLSVDDWRAVPTDNTDLGETARDSEPHVAQALVRPDGCENFERALYVGRQAAEAAVDHDRFYVCSLDPDTVAYKGLLKGTQLAGYYPDLRDERVETGFALVHARFSTNTLGAWDLAHPFRTIVHNGEFNTIDGNVNWMRAREADLRAEGFTDDELDTVLPVIDDPEQSDTASVDNALELLLQTGRSLPHALRMLVPEAWQGDDEMSDARRDFYDYHASLVEPWDGPALVVGTDGDRVGAVLDRNGLRPCRYEVRSDGTLVMASEQGALESDASDVAERGRLQPGELFLAEPGRGVVDDEDVFGDLTDDRYGEWVDDEQVRLATGGDTLPRDPTDDLRAEQAMFGYTEDELSELVAPMAEDGHDPVGSMGDDAPLPGVSEFDLPLASYFRQLFAQVTNPPIDYLREDLVTSLETRLGRQRNLLGESPEHARQVVLDSPVLADADLDALYSAGRPAETVDLAFDPDDDLEAAVERVQAAAEAAVEDGAELVVLSQRAAGEDALPVPSLLATGAVHHRLVREGLRARVGLVVEAGDVRTVHQLAATVGYGAGAVNPYLAIQSVRDLVAGPDGPDAHDAVASYVGALEDGLLKVQSKMGISTVESYRGAQIFEAVGLDESVVERFFEGTPNRTGGADLDDLAADVRARHEAGFGGADPRIDRIGEFENRTGGRHHQWNPDTVHSLHEAVEGGDYDAFREYASHVNEQTERLQTLRGLLDVDTADRDPIPVEDVEPVEDIVERFSTAAMSLGSLSPEAHETNAEAANELGAKANTGEGGEPPERFDTDRECAIKQVASGRFGVTSTYLGAADDLQIKMAQGSKPGEGGHLPGSKVNEMIADVRCSTPGVGLISPPPQHDIYSIEDLKQLIADLRAANPDARVHVKLVAEAGIGTVAAGCAKAGADCIHISGHSGGTGASPKTSIKHAGLPWELGLAEANQLLRETGLRSRVTLRVDGGLKTGRDVAVGALLGAEEFAFGTASLVSAGCVMARICHTNNCPTGVATQDPELRQRYRGTPERVGNYLRFVARELREVAADLGYETVDDLVGRVEHLSQAAADSERANGLDLSRVLAEPSGDDRMRTRGQDAPDVALDEDLISAAGPALAGDGSVSLSRSIDTSDRSVGARLSHAVTSKHGTAGLPEDSVRVSLDGTAGQSFGAFLASGVTFDLTGAANDYVGKGLSGGTLAVETPPGAGFDPAENTVVGNVALYGATDGECYVNGVAGERFAVRNSGANAVVEGVGDHGCEYMTGGIVVVLGDVGRNFAAGMSGGVAYVHDPDGDFVDRCNTEMVRVSRDLSDRDEAAVRRLVENHAARTDSERAADLLADWPAAVSEFAVVMPDAYRDAIDERPEADARRSLPASVCEDPSVAGSAD
ncbi:glutamate synthase large subunit [Halobacterium jilantaiense]|uniref:Glutamate synthase (NADPH/NADH) large chain n=1 Tax=Halobacterium jilantaiense TaxID=355548 RepID=A0A1I0NTZ6_9EURY|nr:glutamate synthase large subunit [Halobacterium jilantaiense]SEW05084.1 glutamate synthase (NADPH/NADH) large chain [Halobacterium jilantaiense]